MKLYLYEHCPFCVRVQWFARLKDIKLEEVALLNDDEATPISLIGAKMLPILITEDGRAMPESLDIIAELDKIGEPLLADESIHPALQQWLSDTATIRRHLTYPRMCDERFEEFATQSARDYFTAKKSKTIGDFQTSLDNTETYVNELAQHWETLANCLRDDWSDKISINDITLFPVLYNLSLVNELTMPQIVADYVQTQTQRTGLPERPVVVG